MFSWLYQLLLSFVARVLSWFGVSFSAKEVQEVQEAVQQVLPKKEDEPQSASSSGPQPYSLDAPQEPLA